MDTPRRRIRDREPLAQINVTPLVDVILVLLIIFMVTASMGQTGITVNLPQAKAAPVVVADDRVTVSIDASLRLYVNSEVVELSKFKAQLSALVASRTDKSVFLKADQGVSYGDFIRVVALVKAAGVRQLGMLTEAPPGTP